MIIIFNIIRAINYSMINDSDNAFAALEAI